MPVCDRTDLAYDRAGPGDGVPLVLLHAGVADRRMWEPQWEDLTAVHDVVRLDLRGFGESDRRPVGAWSTHGDVLATLDYLGVAAAHVVGCSFGAGVAVELALTRPELVASLLLVSPGGALIEERTPELAAFIEAEGDALDRGDLDAAVRANVDTWVVSPRRSHAEVDPAVRDLVGRMQRRAFEVTADWEDVEDAEVELDPAAPARYGEVVAPTLVLTGGLDLDAVQVAASRVVAGVPGARRVAWPGTAHLPSLERPAEFTRLLLAHVELSAGRVRVE